MSSNGPSRGQRLANDEAAAMRAKAQLEKHARIRKLIGERMPVKVIARRLGVGLNTVDRIRREMGVGQLPSEAAWEDA